MTSTGLAWAEAGLPSGRAIVLVPPLGATQAIWDGVVDGLATHHRVIRMDLRGHGGSAGPPGPYEIADLGEDLLRLLDALDLDSATLGGVSIGGMGALWVAEHAPERVDRLILCCTSAKLGPARGWQDRAALVGRDGMGSVAAAVAGRWVTPGWVDAHPREFEALTAMVRSVDPAAYAEWCLALARMDLRAELEAVTAPTLVIAGAEDGAIPNGDVDELVRRIPGARRAVIQGAAHNPPLERPDAMLDLILDHLDAAGREGR